MLMAPNHNFTTNTNSQFPSFKIRNTVKVNGKFAYDNSNIQLIPINRKFFAVVGCLEPTPSRLQFRYYSSKTFKELSCYSPNELVRSFQETFKYWPTRQFFILGTPDRELVIYNSISRKKKMSHKLPVKSNGSNNRHQNNFYAFCVADSSRIAVIVNETDSIKDNLFYLLDINDMSTKPVQFLKEAKFEAITSNEKGCIAVFGITQHKGIIGIYNLKDDVWIKEIDLGMYPQYRYPSFQADSLIVPIIRRDIDYCHYLICYDAVGNNQYNQRVFEKVDPSQGIQTIFFLQENNILFNMYRKNVGTRSGKMYSYNIENRRLSELDTMHNLFIIAGRVCISVTDWAFKILEVIN